MRVWARVGNIILFMARNRTRGGSSRLRCVTHCLVRGFCWLPVVFVAGFMLWCYYVSVFVVMIFQGPGLPDKPIAVRVILLVVGHVILILQLTSYVRAIVCRHKPMPSQFKLTEETLERMAQEDVDEQRVLVAQAHGLPVHTLSRGGGVRWCVHCECIKPDRCHHCSTCGKCVLKMDHHCPWVNNCVGYYNYKFFLLFLIYTILLCVYTDLSIVYDFSYIVSNIAEPLNTTAVDTFPANWARFNTLFLFFLVFCFALAVSFLLFFHIYLVCNNKTTIENMEPPHFPDGPDNKMYDFGCCSNLRQVFGSNVISALLPVFTSEGDGVEFPMRRGEQDRQEAWSRRGSGRDPPHEDEPDTEPSETDPLRQPAP